MNPEGRFKAYVIDSGWLQANGIKNILKRNSRSGDFEEIDDISEISSVRNTFIKEIDVLGFGEKDGIPVNYFSSAEGKEEDCYFEFRVLDNEYLVPHEAIRVVEVVWRQFHDGDRLPV